jgi:hypothetical protein
VAENINIELPWTRVFEVKWFSGSLWLMAVLQNLKKASYLAKLHLDRNHESLCSDVGFPQTEMSSTYVIAAHSRKVV